MRFILILAIIAIGLYYYLNQNTKENFLIEVKKLDSEYDSCYPGCGGKGVTGCIASGPYNNPCNGNERVCNSCIWCEWDSIRGKCVPAGQAIRPPVFNPWISPYRSSPWDGPWQYPWSSPNPWNIWGRRWW